MRATVPLLLLSVLLSGCTHEPGSLERKITLEDDRFEPDAVTLPANTTLNFENAGDRQHTVTILAPGRAGEPAKDVTLAPGDDTTFTFLEPGEHSVHCRFHGTPAGGMRMQVTVA